MDYPSCVLFGGTGFIGSHLARHLLTRGISDRIYLCDIVPPDRSALPAELAQAVDEERVKYVELDVRRPIHAGALPMGADLVVNLAAIHREPGHAPAEYFETNLLGAEHVCEWATRTGSATLVFTSSIAPYGPTEEAKSEDSLTVPATPYGSSKLAAEKIHIGWQQADAARRLLIVRCGVVFGPGEGGNVTRLIQAVLGRFFVYMGNRRTRKAGGYVKELCRSMVWVLERQRRSGRGAELYNFTMDPAPSVEEYVETICRVARIKRRVPSVPYPLVYAVALVARTLARPLGLDQRLDPVRVRKLVRSNNIVPRYLRREGYSYRFTLEQAMQDWRAERPDEWKGR